jgi:hypothetical protein
MREYHNVPGVYGLLIHAINKDRAEGFALNGDLNTMSIQADVLRAQGFTVTFNDVYPIVQTEDEFKRALQLFWDREVPGWWNYREKMIQYDICNKNSWTDKLQSYTAKSKD